MPGCMVVAYPLDEVLESPVVGAAVEDSLNLVLLLPIDDHRGGWRLDLARKGVGGGVFEERDVEDRVEADGVR